MPEPLFTEVDNMEVDTDDEMPPLEPVVNLHTLSMLTEQFYALQHMGVGNDMPTYLDLSEEDPDS